MNCWIPCCVCGWTVDNGGQLLRHGVVDIEATDAPEDFPQPGAGKGTVVKEIDKQFACGKCWGVKHLGGQDELTNFQPDTLGAFQHAGFAMPSMDLRHSLSRLGGCLMTTTCFLAPALLPRWWNGANNLYRLPRRLWMKQPPAVCEPAKT